jgi:transposase-like protein
MGRPTGVNLDKETKAKITELYLAGVSSAEIARQLGVAKSTVTRHTLREGLREKLESAGKRLTASQIAEIKSLYQTTYLPKEHIAKMLGISVDSVNHHTKGLSREIPADTISELVNLYLSGDITADKVKELTGLPKHQFYAEVAKEAIKHG